MFINMGGNSNSSLDSSSTPTPTPVTPTKVNKYPHIPVHTSTVSFYSKVEGINGKPFVCNFSITAVADGSFTLQNLSFQFPTLRLEGNTFKASHGPLILSSEVSLTLDDFLAGKTIPLADIHGALTQN